MTERRDYFEGVPQATEREREWASGVAKLIVDITRRHQGGTKGDAHELEKQIAH